MTSSLDTVTETAPGSAQAAAVAASSGTGAEPVRPPDDVPVLKEPERNFRAVRLAFVILLVASVILPLVYVGSAAYIDLANRRDLARSETERVARIAEEHAIKVFDLNQSLDERIQDLLGDASDTQIRENASALQSRITKLGGGYPQVSSIAVIDAGGRMILNSTAPNPVAGDFRDRLDFSAIVAAPTLSVSPTHAGAVTGKAIFTTSAARRSTSGQLLDVVSVALRADYFANFYRDLVGDEPSLTVGLARDDGTLLARYPNERSVVRSAGAGDDRGASGAAASGGGRTFAGEAVHALPFQPIAMALQRLMSTDAERGSMHGEGLTLYADGAQTVLAYRRLSGYPVYVFASYPSAALVSAWLSHLSLLAVGVFVPCAVLWAVILFALRRLSIEERDWRAWQEEAATRRSVELAFRQARRTEALGNLVGSVAHDFNNLLMTMSSNAQVLRRRGFYRREPDGQAPRGDRVHKDGKDGKDGKDEREAAAEWALSVEHSTELAAIERAIRTGRQLTRQLLGVARKQPQRVETLWMPQWLPRAIPLLIGSLRPDIHLSTDIAATTWQVDVDAAELELALINIAVNARDAMPDGGTLHIVVENIHLGDGQSAGASALHARSGAPGLTADQAADQAAGQAAGRAGHGDDYVRISLTDSGTGMTADVLSHVFEPLFTTKPLGMGTGLGLPQVSNFCEQAGGTVTAESTPGRGATIRLYLPPSKRGRALPESESDGQSSSGGQIETGTPATPLSGRDAGRTPQSAAAPVTPASSNLAGKLDGGAAAAQAVPGIAVVPPMQPQPTQPVHSAPQAPQAPHTRLVSPAAPMPSALSILLVEDNPEVAAGTEALLDVLGHRAHWVDNADSALALLMAVEDSTAAGFDMVLSDIHMPGSMNGIDLALALRHQLPRLPIVLVTGYASELDRAKHADIDVLGKPFDVEVLESLLHKAVATRVN